MPLNSLWLQDTLLSSVRFIFSAVSATVTDANLLRQCKAVARTVSLLLPAYIREPTAMYTVVSLHPPRVVAIRAPLARFVKA